MIFEEIRIRNLFSYYGEQTFKFPAPSAERPVVLISGRNGYGKTSFINSVKLFFLGTSDTMMRGVQAGVTLRPPTYLLGKDREWQGAFNRRAQQERQGDYSVSIVWREDEGRVEATRGWRLTTGEPELYLHISTDFDIDLSSDPDGREITDIDAAEEFLERRLPKSVVPFFFYDGEQVQALAEANREGQMRKIEKLLDISAIDTLDEYLQRVINGWRRGGQAPEAQAEVDSLRAKVQQKQAEYARYEAERDDYQADIANIERDIRRNERQMDTIRAQSRQRDLPRLKERVTGLSGQLEHACHALAERLPPAAPIWANPQLVARVASLLDEATGNANQLLAEEMRTILQRLPVRLFDEAPHPKPPLTDTQKTHYRKKLENIFSQYVDTSGDGFYGLASADALALKRRFDFFTQQSSNERRSLGDALRQISELRQQLREAQDEVNAVDDISPEEQRQFRARQEAIAEARAKRDDLLKQQTTCENSLNALQREIDELEQDVRAKETELVKKAINSQRIDLARKAQRVFDSYKQSLKESRRVQIEEAINRRFKQLMSSHELIHYIEIDADFALTYRDADGNPIGMASISAGMKQLAAQALLAALSETTARKVPIIVDTPLARIDRQNQENLLLNFYPQAGEQVIVLPTDSELDEAKYRLLLPYVADEFQLINGSGERTEIRRGAMYGGRKTRGARRGE